MISHKMYKTYQWSKYDNELKKKKIYLSNERKLLYSTRFTIVVNYNRNYLLYHIFLKFLNLNLVKATMLIYDIFLWETIKKEAKQYYICHIAFCVCLRFWIISHTILLFIIIHFQIIFYSHKHLSVIFY